jgi:hypothetical protein
MFHPPDRTVNELLEDRRKEILRLMAGALRHIGVDKHDISVMKRKGVNVFNPDLAVFIIKADTEPTLTPEQVSFIVQNLRNMNYSVKRVEHRDERLFLFV